MKREQMIEMAAKGLMILLRDTLEAEKRTPELMQPLLEDAVDAFLQPNMDIRVRTNWVPTEISPVMIGQDGWIAPTDEMLRIPPVSIIMIRLQELANVNVVRVGINAWTKPESIGHGPQAAFVIWVQAGDGPVHSLHIRTETFPRGLPSHTKQYIPDVDSRSINEPCYLMSAKDVRNIFGGHYPEYWEFEKLKKLAEGLGWYEVEQHGNQILFRAKLAIRREEA
ncbi:hypothetical protein G173_gp097 [Erwinia phage phiEaH2]|uniref:Uncharacterized protein n=1 Tax=Erwinia phage phiEaH2 TaxID=1029988 RepID=J7KJG5_9CAUD|nr:hypothetical protein G173_gp097 [Erwinia phage phiEaH2]AFQ96642.1 hypothetical protein [Erwinia phage phiEaH2]